MVKALSVSISHVTVRVKCPVCKKVVIDDFPVSYIGKTVAITCDNFKGDNQCKTELEFVVPARR